MSDPRPPTVRFAPSPTGRLHVGNVRAALVNWLFARTAGGRFILRIDDTDRERSTADNEAAIKRDLEWLGLTWDDTFRQSDRLDRYDEAARTLKAAGRLYPCYETAEELDLKRRVQRSRGLPPVYDRAALSLSEADRATLEGEGRRPHWRFKLELPARIQWHDLVRGPVSIDLASVSDPILVREDGSYLYTLPSVVDDIDSAITHIVRGEDHVTNSAVQVQLFQALGGTSPAYAHLALLTGKGGEGLSKRHGALSIEALREEHGIEALAITALLARLGTSDPVEPVADMDTLVAGFDFAKFSRAAAKFDPDELAALNAKLLHLLPFQTVRERVAVDEAFWLAVRPNLARLDDIAAWQAIVDGPVTPVIAADDRDYLQAARASLPDGPLTAESWGCWTQALKSQTGRKGRALFLPLRQALTGQSHGPDMSALLPLIGRDKAAARLEGTAA